MSKDGTPSLLAPEKVRFVRDHPFSIMALCNILGDLGYLGFAFESVHGVSAPKLAGALLTILAHTILLAYGDDQAQRVQGESGSLSRFVLMLRGLAQRATCFMPEIAHQKIRRWPVGVTFSVLALNGVALLADALVKGRGQGDFAMLEQGALGAFIAMGCLAFAAADFVKGQRGADVLTKTAPSIFIGATILQIALALTLLSPFLTFSVLIFALSNYAGFFTRLEKRLSSVDI